MKTFLCVVLWFLPMTLLAQSPFDGTWKTNLLSPAVAKPFVYSVNSGMYDCQSCSPKINVKADGRTARYCQTYDTIAVRLSTRIRFTSRQES